MKTDTPTTVRLGEADRGAVARHFLALGDDDRRLRFGARIADAGIEAYVARLDFAADGLYAVQDASLEVVAMVHIAITGQAAELGLSVLPGERGRGLGNALFQRAVNFLRNRGAVEIHVHCLAENGAMMHLARKNGMRIVYSGGESDARLELEPATADSFISEWLEDQEAGAERDARAGGLQVD